MYKYIVFVRGRLLRGSRSSGSSIFDAVAAVEAGVGGGIVVVVVEGGGRVIVVAAVVVVVVVVVE